ncbi:MULTISPECIES: DUF6207 family protein [Streptomyces]|uniref:DUF6207 family protein n=1 Tax=Streptomyces violaceus TaxID=1936 RepID=A0ABZ1NIR3_STRVL
MHVQGPGMVVLDVAAADAVTALTLQAVFAERWATAMGGSQPGIVVPSQCEPDRPGKA